MGNALTVQLGLKEDGGFQISPWQKTIVITKGQQCKVGIVLSDSSGLPVTITGYTIKLKLPVANGTPLVKTALAINNNKGESEVELLPDDTALLLVGPKQSCEIEVMKSATVKSFYPMKASFEVVDQLIQT